MTPEQDKAVIELLEKHVLVQKWILGVLAAQALVIVGIGGFLLLGIATRFTFGG